MNPGHVSEQLHQLLVGNLSNSEMLVVADHLRDCQPCRDELVEVSFAHALLTSVSDLLAPEFGVVAKGRSEEPGSQLPRPGFLDGPPDGCSPGADEGSAPIAGDRQPRGFEHAPRRTNGEPPRRVHGEPCLPIAVALDGETGAVGGRPHRRRPAAASRSRRPGHARRSMYRSGILAIAVAMASFGAIIAAGSLQHQRPSNPGRIVLAVSLKPLAAARDAAGAVVLRANGNVTIATSGLLPPPLGHYYEVWLIDPGTPRMQPLGVLPAVGVGNFSFPASLWRGYSGVDVSLRAKGAPPRSSGVDMLSTLTPWHPALSGRHAGVPDAAAS